MKKLKRVLFVKVAKMFRGNKNTVPCIISAGTKIVGNITDGDIIQIDGALVGDISCKELIVGPKGSIQGTVVAKSLDLYGVLDGKLEVENLFISGTAKFNGDSVYKTIAIEPGAELVGNCSKSK